MMIFARKLVPCMLLLTTQALHKVNIVEAQALQSKRFICRNTSSNNKENGCSLGGLGTTMHRIKNEGCQEKCAFVPLFAVLFGWKCGACEDPITITSPASRPPPVASPVMAPAKSPVAKPSSPIIAPMKVPIGSPIVKPPSPIIAPVKMPTATSISKCGGAVNTGGLSANSTCASDLWNPTQSTSMHCYAYGGATDPCALHNNNDANDGLYKTPSKCDRDTFYLWDEVCSDDSPIQWIGVSFQWFPHLTFCCRRSISSFACKLFLSRIRKERATLGQDRNG
jgi:hypothetical protein